MLHRVTKERNQDIAISFEVIIQYRNIHEPAGQAIVFTHVFTARMRITINSNGFLHHQ